MTVSLQKPLCKKHLASCLALEQIAGWSGKKSISFTSHSEISPEYSGDSLIYLQHLEGRLNIDFFGLLCFVEDMVLYSRERLLENNEDVSQSKPLYTSRQKAESHPQVVR